MSTISGVDTTEAAVDDDSGGATRALDCWATVTASDRTAVGGPHGALACGDVPTGGTLRSPRWFVYGLLAIAVVALGVRIGYTLRVADDLVLTGDAQTYHLLAARLADGDGYVRVGGALEGAPTAEFPPLFPAVLAASVGFMLPVATAPNAIAYGSGHVTARDMLREGAVLDLIGVVVLSAVCYVAFV